MHSVLDTHTDRESLHYAREIQQALMPKERHFRRTGLESALYFRPKEILSGDFYWLGIKEQTVFFAVGDCTGHGIPSALLSVLGINLLNYVVFSKNITDPACILQEMDKKWIETFQDEDYDVFNNDWCDIALCVIHKQHNILEFSGAHSPMLILRNNGESLLTKGEKFPIGGWQLEKYREYKTHRMEFQKGDVFALFSDGIIHQFGGNYDKKFGLSKLKEILQRNVHLPLQEVMGDFEDYLNCWMKNSEPTDDRTLLLVKNN